MKIINRTSKCKLFSDLSNGEVFMNLECDTAFIVIEDCRFGDTDDLINAVELESGCLVYFDAEEQVVPVSAVLTVE